MIVFFIKWTTELEKFYISQVSLIERLFNYERDVRMFNRWLFGVVVVISFIAIGIQISSHNGAAVMIDEDIAQNTTWTSIGNPWIIQRSIYIRDGAVLTIEPGVEVKLNGHFSINCLGSGKIVAIGRDVFPVKFNSMNPALYNYTHIDTGVGGIIRYCTFSNGDTSLIVDSDAIIENNNFTNSQIGSLVIGDDVEIINCILFRCEIGIQVDGASRASIVGCDVSYGIRGIHVIGSSDSTTIERCYVHNTEIRGIELETSGQRNRVMNSTVRWGNMGALVWNSKDVLIYGLNVSDSRVGIGVAFSSTNMLLPIRIQRCRITDCTEGIWLSGTQWTIFNETTVEGNQVGIRDSRSLGQGILFWRNNFLWNKALVDLDSTGINWSTNDEGNYWSDYVGDDADGDGIGDIPHNVGTMGQDPFPLMRPIDFHDPHADAGNDIIIRQHDSFSLDGTASTDDTWVANWTWTILLPGDDLVLHGAEPTGVIDIHGNFSVILRVTDPVGKFGEDSISIVVTDGDPPSFLDVSVPDSVFTGDDLNISCTVLDNGAMDKVMFEYMFGAGPLSREDLIFSGNRSWFLKLEVPINLDADIYYVLIARDQRGNVNSTDFVSIRVIDDVPPELETNLPDLVTTGEDTILLCNVTDNIRVNRSSVEWWFRESPHQISDLTRNGSSWQHSIGIPSNANTPLSVRFVAVDHVGNIAESSTLEIDVVDNDPPIFVSFSSHPDLERINKGEGVDFYVEVEDNLGIERVYIDLHYYGTEWEHVELKRSGGTFYEAIIIAPDKGNRFWFRFNASDPTGNMATTDVIQIELLSNIPVITTIPPTQVHEDEEFRLPLTAEDPDNAPSEFIWTLETNASWLLDVDNELVGIPTDDDVGWYYLNVSVSDGEGGEAWLIFNLTVIDVNHPPVVAILSPSDGVKAGSKLDIVGTTTDDENQVMWVHVQVDDGDWVEADGTINWNLLIDTSDLKSGTHQVVVIAYDGYSESEESSVTFIVPEPEDGGRPSLILIGMILLLSLILLIGIIFVHKRQQDSY